jgi:hypothetical protein
MKTLSVHQRQFWVLLIYQSNMKSFL